MQKINFLQYKKYGFIISICFIIVSFVLTAFFGGPVLGLDFSPGVVISYDVEGVTDFNIIQNTILEKISDAQVQELETQDDATIGVSVRVQDTGSEEFQAQITNELNDILSGLGTITLNSELYVGSQFSSDLEFQSVLLIVIAFVLILLYLSFRFQYHYGLAALITLLHDVLIMLGFIGLFRLEISASTVAALLTIIGYSLNDTIVIFDRIRENIRLATVPSLTDIMNISITQSLRRTIITSLTTFFAVMAMLIVSTGSIQQFALNLVIGIGVGTYSSIFTASPLLLFFLEGKKKAASSVVVVNDDTNNTEVLHTKGKSGKKVVHTINIDAAKREILEKKNKKKRS